MHSKPSAQAGQPDQTELDLFYSRDASGHINGTTETQVGAQSFEWFYHSDGLKRLKQARQKEGEIVRHTYDYVYDGASNRTKETVDGVERSFTYNCLDQLIKETPATGTGDERSLTYDVFGSLKTETKKGATAPELTYEWDAENRLKSVSVAAEGTRKAQTIAYTYDSQGTRVTKSLKVDSADEKKTNYLTEYLNPSGYSQTLGESDPAAPTSDRAYAFDDTGLLMQEVRPDAGSAYNAGYMLGDQVGTSRVLTDAGGQPAANGSLTYAPFGQITSDVSGDKLDAIHHAFTGQYREPETGLQYHRARWLNPARAAWLSQDPVYDWPGNFGNAYMYAGLDPLENMDRAGQNVYAVTRRLGIRGGPILDYINSHHVYVAFTDSHMGQLWRRTLREFGFRNDAQADLDHKLDNRTYAEWITFSFHPTNVRNEKVHGPEPYRDCSNSPTGNGNYVSTFYTEGWDIIFNDYNADIVPLDSEPEVFVSESWEGRLGVSWGMKRVLYLAAADEQNQVNVFRACMWYYDNRGSGIYGDYSLLVQNCGGWTKDVLDSQGCPWWPWINNGFGTNGMLDWTQVPKAGYIVSVTGYKTWQCLTAQLGGSGLEVCGFEFW